VDALSLKREPTPPQVSRNRDATCDRRARHGGVRQSDRQGSPLAGVAHRQGRRLTISLSGAPRLCRAPRPLVRESFCQFCNTSPSVGFRDDSRPQDRDGVRRAAPTTRSRGMVLNKERYDPLRVKIVLNT